MITVSFRQWIKWFLLLVGALYVGILVGVFPRRPVQEAVQWLASRPGVGEAFQDPYMGQLEAFSMLVVWLVVTPLAALVVVLLLRGIASLVEGLLEPLWRQLKLSERVVTAFRVAIRVGLVAAAVGVASAQSPTWMPHALHMLGLVARAYLTLQS